MDTLIEILNELDDSVDYRNEMHLVDDRILDSMAMVSLVGEIEAEFDVEIEPKDMVTENFNSVQAMMNMIERLREED